MRVGIIGCGIVGAAIAYTLSQHTDWQITVWDQRSPHQWQATGAALGILMGVLRTKLKGKHLRLGLASLQAYEHLIPELEVATGLTIPYNRHGILQLCFDPQDLFYWQKTQAVRQRQGFTLDILNHHQLVQRFPHLATARQISTGKTVVGAIYSPADRQLDPKITTQALIAAATHNGVQFHWQSPVQGFQHDCPTDLKTVTHVCVAPQDINIDTVVLAAGLGSQHLTTDLGVPLALQPVLGQAFSVKALPQLPQQSPVINGEGFHLYPCPDGSWVIGATVEFPTAGDQDPPVASVASLEALKKTAIALYPPLAQAEIIQTWSGLRPRPDGRPAPVIEYLPGYTNVITATGHYRNGVLMAPVTAQRVLDLLKS